MKKFFSSALVVGAVSISFGLGTAYGSVIGTMVTYSMLDCNTVP